MGEANQKVINITAIATWIGYIIITTGVFCFLGFLVWALVVCGLKCLENARKLINRGEFKLVENINGKDYSLYKSIKNAKPAINPKVVQDAISALMAMGESKAAATKLIGQAADMSPPDTTTDQLLSVALCKKTDKVA